MDAVSQGAGALLSPDKNNSQSNTSQNGDTKALLMSALAALSELPLVEELIRSKISSDAELLEEIPLYLLGLGGKRMRPALTLLIARAFGGSPIEKNVLPKVLDVAAGIELIHMATLLHDDIIDKSPLRRHKKSPFIRFGVPSTLLAGDFLLVRAFSLCARLDRFIIDQTEQACIELTEGEILEIPLHLKAHTLETSLEIARKKTAALFRLAAVSGAFYSVGEGPTCEHLSSFGQHLGTAFQILDDILDVTADESLLGKKSGMDLVERKPSIVNLLWLESKSVLAKRLLVEPGTQAAEDRYVASSLQELIEGDSVAMEFDVIARARELALFEIKAARRDLEKAESLSEVVDSESMAALHALIDFTVERMH